MLIILPFLGNIVVEAEPFSMGCWYETRRGEIDLHLWRVSLYFATRSRLKLEKQHVGGRLQEGGGSPVGD